MTWLLPPQGRRGQEDKVPGGGPTVLVLTPGKVCTLRGVPPRGVLRVCSASVFLCRCSRTSPWCPSCGVHHLPSILSGVLLHSVPSQGLPHLGVHNHLPPVLRTLARGGVRRRGAPKLEVKRVTGFPSYIRARARDVSRPRYWTKKWGQYVPFWGSFLTFLGPKPWSGRPNLGTTGGAPGPSGG